MAELLVSHHLYSTLLIRRIKKEGVSSLPVGSLQLTENNVFCSASFTVGPKFLFDFTKCFYLFELFRYDQSTSTLNIFVEISWYSDTTNKKKTSSTTLFSIQCGSKDVWKNYFQRLWISVKFQLTNSFFWNHVVFIVNTHFLSLFDS